MAKLLVFTPTYGDGPNPATLASIAALQFDGELVHEISWHNPYPGASMQNVCAQYIRARQMVLDGDYDALLAIEHDMTVPPHAAATLWNDGAPVVYGVYQLRHGSYAINVHVKSGAQLAGTISLRPKEFAKARAAGRYECGGVGFGCTLIRRHVLGAIPFRMTENTAPDMPFARDCLKKGIRQIARFDVACGHIEDGKELRPFDHGGVVIRALALHDTTLDRNGQPFVLEKGSYYTLTPEVAKKWRDAGHVQITIGTV